MSAIAMTTDTGPLRIRLERILLWMAVVVVTVIALYPFVWAVITSFKPQREALQPSLIPFVQFEPIMDNWNAELGRTGEENFAALKNSAIIALGATAVALTLGTTAGYSLARFRFGIGNRNLVSWFLSQRFLPPVATLIPFFLMLQELDLYDSRLGMIIVNATFVMPFAVLITRDFSRSPKDPERRLRTAHRISGVSACRYAVCRSSDGRGRHYLLYVRLERVPVCERAHCTRCAAVHN
jgi:ABC-type glycerol-3-phosphate transport system permease component